MTEKLLLDCREVAELLGCCWRSILNWELQGRIPAAVRLGKLKRWHRSTLLAWLEEQTSCREDKGEEVQG